jgi:hypothetical protein
MRGLPKTKIVDPESPFGQLFRILSSWDCASIFFVSLALLMGAYVRVRPVLNTDFPLNDGGLFYVMIQDLQQAHYILPSFTTYNHLQIPFVYPPLPFYFVGILSDLMGWSVIDVLRVLPAIVATLTILVFYLLAWDMLKSKSQAAIAVFAFAMLPRAFEWMIMGGGLTRSIGFFFAILAIRNAYRLYRKGSTKYILFTIIFSELTILCHPEDAWFLTFTIGLLILFFCRNLAGLGKSVILFLGTLLLSSPWLINLINHHGIGPLITGSQSGHGTWFTLAPFLTLDLTFEAFLNIMGVIGLLGLFVHISERKFLLPAWVLSVYVVSPRSAAAFVTLPFAMLVGVAMDRLVLRGFNDIGASKPPISSGSDSNSWAGQLLQSRSSKLVFGFFVYYTFFFSVIYPVVGASSLHSLSRDERKAMRWVSINTPKNSEFVVITSKEDVWQDRVSEWFPALADRPSIATVQGYEWIPDQFYFQWSRYLALQDCAKQNAGCLDKWAQDFDMPFSHIFLARGDDVKTMLAAKILKASLLSSTDYKMIYESSEVAIFEKRAALISSIN